MQLSSPKFQMQGLVRTKTGEDLKRWQQIEYCHTVNTFKISALIKSY
jgi:hypothetical protein